MPDNQVQANLNLQISIPAIATDGNALSVNNETGETSLVFFQIAPNPDPKPEQVQGNAVANVRLTFQQLKQLNEAISKAVKNYEAKKS